MDPMPKPGRLSEDALSVLVERSDRKGLARLALHVVVIAAAGTLCASAVDTSWMLSAAWLHGTVLVFLFAPLHETVHYTAFRSRWINRAVSAVCGWILVLPPRYFRAFHLEHHRYTQDLERDPELAIPPPATWSDYLWRVSGFQYWTSRVRTTLAHAAGRVAEPFLVPAERAGVVREARLYLASYALVAAISIVTGSAALLWLWVVPVVLGQPMLRLYLLAEHTGCRMVPDMLANSRTVHTNAIVRFLSWNMPYHAEHHAYAAIPFHALPRAHAALAPHVRTQSPGYASVHRELIRGLR